MSSSEAPRGSEAEEPEDKLISDRSDDASALAEDAEVEVLDAEVELLELLAETEVADPLFEPKLTSTASTGLVIPLAALWTLWALRVEAEPGEERATADGSGELRFSVRRSCSTC